MPYTLAEAGTGPHDSFSLHSMAPQFICFTARFSAKKNSNRIAPKKLVIGLLAFHLRSFAPELAYEGNVIILAPPAPEKKLVTKIKLIIGFPGYTGFSLDEVAQVIRQVGIQRSHVLPT